MAQCPPERGNVVLLKDVLDKAVEKALEIITAKNPNLADKETVAEQVGVGASTVFRLGKQQNQGYYLHF